MLVINSVIDLSGNYFHIIEWLRHVDAMLFILVVIETKTKKFQQNNNAGNSDLVTGT